MSVSIEQITPPPQRISPSIGQTTPTSQRISPQPVAIPPTTPSLLGSSGNTFHSVNPTTLQMEITAPAARPPYHFVDEQKSLPYLILLWHVEAGESIYFSVNIQAVFN